MAPKADLLDRSIILELEPIAKNERKDEHTLWNDFDNDKPFIIGGAFSYLSKAMQLFPDIHPKELGRMADFTIWGSAIAEAMGIDGPFFREVYFKNLAKSSEEAVSAHPVASAVIALMAEQAMWTGTISELLNCLAIVAGKQRINTSAKEWPKAPHVLSQRLKEVKSNLAQLGIEYEIQNVGYAKRIHIKKIGSNKGNEFSPAPRPQRPRKMADPRLFENESKREKEASEAKDA